MKLGRLPARPEAEAPRLKLGPYLQPAALPPTPAVVDWVSKVSTWPMYRNDAYGDCVWAMIGHQIEAFTTYAGGATVKVSDADVLRGYSDVTGFNLNDPGSDQGTVIQDALNYWRKTGVGGHKILAFAEVDPRNAAEVDTALALFGHLCVGVDFPNSAMAQFDRRQPWDVVPDDGGIDGGHAVNLGYDAGTNVLKVVTWARVQELTPAWWQRYASECWAVISPEWLDAAGRSPAGLDLYGLGQALASLTNGENPFPSPPPAPTPVPPSPSPSPAPRVDDADRYLAGAVTDWAHARHSGPGSRVAQAMRAWLKAKGL